MSRKRNNKNRNRFTFSDVLTMTSILFAIIRVVPSLKGKIPGVI